MTTIKTEIRDKGVYVITLNRPKVLNSLNKEIIDELLEAFEVPMMTKKFEPLFLLEKAEVFVVEQILLGEVGPVIPVGLQENRPLMQWK